MKYFLLILLLSNSLFASTIEYHGSGVAHFTKTGTKYSCSHIYFRFEITPMKLRFFEGGHSCGPLDAAYDYYVLDIKDGELFLRGQLVGSISANELNLRHSEDESFSYHMNWKFRNNTIEFKETWEELGQKALEITGTLTLKDL